jgi:hypothetical protein
VLLAGIAYGFVGLIGRGGKRVVKELVELARRLRPPKKVIAYAIRIRNRRPVGRGLTQKTFVRFWVTPRKFILFLLRRRGRRARAGGQKGAPPRFVQTNRGGAPAYALAALLPAL